MKWIILALFTALALIGAGVVMTGGEGGGDAISASPEAVLLCEEGTADLHAFRLNAAVDKLGRSLELDPSLAEAAIARAVTFWRLGRSEEMKTELARADSLTAEIKDDSRRMLAELRLSAFPGTRFHTMHDSLLTRLLHEEPRNLYVLEAKATDAFTTNDEAAQEQGWLAILRIDPNHASAYNGLGYLELRRGNYDKAIEYMQKYAFLAPDQANPHDSLGEVLLVLGRYEEAEAEFRQSVKMQPDFYHSLINLGKTYLARGQLSKGRMILEKVRAEVEGSELAKRVDREIVHAYLTTGLEAELGEMTASFVQTYPEDGTSAFYRGMRLAYAGEFQQAQAVMDSALAAWRSDEHYGMNEMGRFSIDSAAKRFDALVAEAAGETATAARLWRNLIDYIDDETPFHSQWFERVGLAKALVGTGHYEAALAELEPILAVNPRIFEVLILATESYLALERPADARRTLDQLDWCVSQSDPDFPPRARAAELARRLTALEGSS